MPLLILIVVPSGTNLFESPAENADAIFQRLYFQLLLFQSLFVNDIAKPSPVFGTGYRASRVGFCNTFAASDSSRGWLSYLW